MTGRDRGEGSRPRAQGTCFSDTESGYLRASVRCAARTGAEPCRRDERDAMPW